MLSAGAALVGWLELMEAQLGVRGYSTQGHLGRTTGAKVGIISWEVLEHSAAGMPQQAG